ncbi:MAG: hypothetical protein AAB209_04740, partial [Bacteroidota bacterium]
DLAALVYNKLTKRQLPKLDSYRRGVSLVKTWEDILAFRQLHKNGELTWSEWLRSLARPHCFLYFKWWDPMPWVFLFYSYWVRQFKKIQASRPKASPTVATPEEHLAKASA